MKIDELISELEQVKEEHGNIEIHQLKTLEDFTLGKKIHAVLTYKQSFTMAEEELP